MLRHSWLCGLIFFLPAQAWGWGDQGHELVNAAAAAALPEGVPACLKESAARLQYLGPEPDRWRYSDLKEMNKGLAPDHFVDLEFLSERIDPGAPPANRHQYAKVLRKEGLDPTKVGFAPYRVVELCQRIEAAVVALEVVNADHPQAAARRHQAEENLVYAAGVLGHYVADLANPHHTTIHYNGWTGRENPENFTRDKRTHFRFESGFVRRVFEELEVNVSAPARHNLKYRKEAWRLVRESNELVDDLYRLDRDGAFRVGNESSPKGREGLHFAQARMVRGATLLRDLWASACAKGKIRAESVKLNMEINERLRAAGIDVYAQVDLERNVVLKGRVSSPAVVQQALEVASGVSGARSVTSQIRALY